MKTCNELFILDAIISRQFVLYRRQKKVIPKKDKKPFLLFTRNCCHEHNKCIMTLSVSMMITHLAHECVYINWIRQKDKSNFHNNWAYIGNVISINKPIKCLTYGFKCRNGISVVDIYYNHPLIMQLIVIILILDKGNVNTCRILALVFARW